MQIYMTVVEIKGRLYLQMVKQDNLLRVAVNYLETIMDSFTVYVDEYKTTIDLHHTHLLLGAFRPLVVVAPNDLSNLLPFIQETEPLYIGTEGGEKKQPVLWMRPEILYFTHLELRDLMNKKFRYSGL